VDVIAALNTIWMNRLADTVAEFDISTMPEKLQRYWTEGEGAARIGWGTPGDFDRCRTNLRAEGVPGRMVDGACANLHKRATGSWPGEKKGAHSMDPVIEAYPETIVASLTAQEAMSGFTPPVLDGPTPFTVTDDGRVFGHVATWGTCHIGFDGACVTPPRSAAEYAYFLTGEVVTDDGSTIPVGTITLGTGHAAAQLGARPAVDHYDNTGTAVAYVTAGEDDHGIWVAGRLRSDATPEQVEALRASSLSGDWRRIAGNLELVAALAVNVPGFPIPRLTAATTGRKPSALVASGVVVRPHPEPLSVGTLTLDIDPDALVAAAVKRARGVASTDQRLTALDRRLGVDRDSRLSRAHQMIERN
jgi:hypothetical protein